MRVESIRRPGRTSGFTLIEVMISLVILAIGLLSILVTQIYSLRDGSRSRHLTTAVAIARDQLELIQRLPYSSANLAPVAWTTPPWLANLSDPSLNPGEIAVRVSLPGTTVTERVYTVNYRVLVDPGGNAELRNIDVEVMWADEGISNNRPTRTGRPTAALSTTIVNNDL